MSILIQSTFLVFACTLLSVSAAGQRSTQDFAFVSVGDTLRGLIETPANRKSNAVIILIPGYGRTDFVNGGWYSELRDTLLATGLTVCFWDKPGCGNSGGTFDAQQPVESSAAEAIAAIEELHRQSVSGLDNLGMWGISRAGWIVPLINRQYPIDFWVSVSGTDAGENFGYLLKTNLLIAGKPPAEAERLHRAWQDGHRLLCTGGSYEDYLAATRPLGQDSFCRATFGYIPVDTITAAGRAHYLAQQDAYIRRGAFDEASGLWHYLPNFGELLRQVDCPVLALFGANDSQVDWRNTKALYERTIGTNPRASLTVRIFEQCNHNLQQCLTCGYLEDLTDSGWQACAGYYRTMTDWLAKQGDRK